MRHHHRPFIFIIWHSAAVPLSFVHSLSLNSLKPAIQMRWRNIAPPAFHAAPIYCMVFDVNENFSPTYHACAESLPWQAREPRRV